MPELPEVETIARTLAPVQGRAILNTHLLTPSSLAGDLPVEAVRGGVLQKPGRRGKLLLLPLSCAGGRDADAVIGLAFHLKMSGRVLLCPAGALPGKHTRLILDLDDGRRLLFDDTRKFGYVRVLTPAVLAAWPFWRGLGPEPLEINGADFAARFQGRHGRIKSLLLDQTVIAGCGNIYADESLFRAGIRPDSRNVPPERLYRLHSALQAVLREAIAACGSSIRDYRTAGGDMGAFQNAFDVYGRSGQPCAVCGARLETCRIAGRTTVFCPVCQQG